MVGSGYGARSEVFVRETAADFLGHGDTLTVSKTNTGSFIQPFHPGFKQTSDFSQVPLSPELLWGADVFLFFII